jgi:hypothetical protein
MRKQNQIRDSIVAPGDSQLIKVSCIIVVRWLRVSRKRYVWELEMKVWSSLTLSAPSLPRP